MISQRIRGFFSLFILLQLLLGLGGYWAHLLLVNHFYVPIISPENYLIYCGLFLFGLVLEATYRYNQDTNCFHKNLLVKSRIALRQTYFSALPVLFYLVATKDQVISRVFLFSFMPVLYLLLFLSIWHLPRWLAEYAFRNARKERTLLVGSSKKAVLIRSWLKQKTELGFDPIGILCNEKPQSIGWCPVLGEITDLEQVIQEQNVTQVILVEFSAFANTLGDLTAVCEKLGVRVLVKSDLEEKFRHQVIHMESDGYQFFGIRAEPLENPLNRMLKRMLDVAIALPVVFFILPPISLLVWLFQLCQSPGPLLYLQVRAGLQNRSFRIIKFRTMHVNNPEVTRQATLNDNRVYAAGRWFRKMSIDEMPQFMNVLLGDMSVVGPRPHLPEHNTQFSRHMQNYYIRSLVKPGITGLAQVRGFRGEATNECLLIKRIESDITYLENWSLGQDLLIILSTVWTMFSPPKTAY